MKMEIRHIFLVIFAFVCYSDAANPTFQKCSSNTDIILVLDASGSIGNKDWKTMKTFVKKLVDKLVGDHVYFGIILFSNDARTAVKLQAVISMDLLKSQIDSLPYLKGKTNTQAGLILAKEMIEDAPKFREEVEKFVICVSDGESNVKPQNTIPAADELKTLAKIVSVGVGNATQIGTNAYIELKGISTGKNVVSVENFDSLSDETVTQICKNFKVVDGAPCPKGHAEIEEGCVVYRCQQRKSGYYWSSLYKGCPYGEECLPWNKEVKKPNDCNTYKCTAKNCAPGRRLCPKTSIDVVTVGCPYKDGCLKENERVRVKGTCEEIMCARINTQTGPIGTPHQIPTGCEKDGKCEAIGFTYEEKCVTYECSLSGFYVSSKKCFYNNKTCVGEDETIEDNCNVFKCVYDNRIEDLDIKQTVKACKDKKCYLVGKKWKDESKCLDLTCVLDKDKNPTIKRTITGCRRDGDSECTPVEGKVSRVNNTCIEYKCQANQKFVLVKKECIDEDGECRADEETWRPDGLCQENECHVWTESNTVKTNIEHRLDCLIGGQCVLRGNKVTKRCITTRCNEKGKPVVIHRACQYKGKCVEIDAEPFVDRSVCKMVDCVEDKNGGNPRISLTEYGCVLFGECLDPDARRQDRDSCIVRQCFGGDHTLYPIVCNTGRTCIKPEESEFDDIDCVNETCVMEGIPPGATLVNLGSGCVFNGKCFQPGDTRGKCVIKRCVGNDVWVTDKAECKMKDGTCVPIGKKWFDKEKCEHLTCSSKNNGNNAVITTEKHGCETRDDCVKHGSNVDNVDNSCTTFECVDGVLNPTKIACDLPNDLPINKECLDEGKSLKVEKVCIEFECNEKSRSKTSIKLELVQEPGCLENGDCFFFNETNDLLCTTFRCKLTPEKTTKLLPDTINGCLDENNMCKAKGAVWENEFTCMKRTCRPDGTVLDTPIGCLDPNDGKKCVRFNNEMHPGNTKCIRYMCTKQKGKPMRSTELLGCPYGDGCKDFDTNWPNLDKCVTEICSLKDGQPVITDIPYGCVSEIDHQCYPFKYIETEPKNKCVKYECEQSQSFAVKRARCVDEGKCYANGATWQDNDTCTEYTCMRENKQQSYRVTMVNKGEDGCQNFQGNCIRPKETARPGNCSEYVCDGETGSLVLTKLQCQTNKGCRKLGEKWFVDGNCTEYTCIKKPNSDTELKIKEVTRGCKDDGGKCFDSGDEKNESCNVFECNGKTRQFLPIITRCSQNGICHEINSSWTSESCITYTCRLIRTGPNFVETDIDEVQGCKYQKKCYKVGFKRTQGCNVKTCQPDGKWKITTFKCKAEDGTCFAPGKNFTDDDCTVLGCDPKTQSEFPIEHGCKHNGECVKVGFTWKNETLCKWYKCQFDEENNDASEQVTQIGCLDGKTCIPPGKQQDDECTVITCVKGQIKTPKLGCAWDDGCIKVGNTRQRGCVWHTCTVDNASPTEITTSLKKVHGCKDCYGKCIAPDHITEHGCIKQKCGKGGKLVTTEIKCFNPFKKECVEVGDIIDNGYMKKKCTISGGFLVIPVPTHCVDIYGNKVGNGASYLNKETCKTMKCVINHYDATWMTVSRGCKDGKNCHLLGTTWFDFTNCKEYKCVNKRFRGRSEPFPTVEAYKGCFSSSKICYKVGQNWHEDCKTKECRRLRKFESKVVTVVEGCVSPSDGSCHSAGEEWVDKFKNQCIHFVCKKVGRKFRPRKVREVCHDSYGGCRDVGDFFFDCNLYGHLYHGCLCNAKKRRSYTSCPGGY